jgi:multiple sugar transport system permease protein
VKKRGVNKEERITRTGKKSGISFFRKEGFQAYLFMIPTLIGFPFLCAWPVLWSIYCAFCDWDGMTSPVFKGLKNFQYLFLRDPIFFRSIRITFTFVLIYVPVSLILGMLLAVLLNKDIKGMKFFRVIYYLPTIVPGVAALVLWQFVYQSDFGLLNNVLAFFHIQQVGWLTDKDVVLLSLSLMKWWGVGGMMMIFLSGLQSVPADVYEAAELDGAHGWKKFTKITFPLITPIFFLQLITGVIGGFQTFVEAQILTAGGPNYGSHFINYDIYQTAFNNNNYGRACAEALVLFVIIMIFTVIVFKKSQQFVYYENDV